MDYLPCINTPTLELIPKDDHELTIPAAFLTAVMAVTVVMVVTAVVAIPVMAIVFTVDLFVKGAPMIGARPIG